MGFTGQNSTDPHLFNGLSVFIHAHAHDLFRAARCDHMVSFNNDISVPVTDIFTGYTPRDPLFQAFQNVLFLLAVLFALFLERSDRHTRKHLGPL